MKKNATFNVSDELEHMYSSHGAQKEGQLPQSGLSNFLKKRAAARKLTRDKEIGLTLKPKLNERKSISLHDARKTLHQFTPYVTLRNHPHSKS